MKEIIITAEDDNRRLDKFLMSYFPSAGYGFIQKMIRKKNITLNDKKTNANVLIKQNDVVKVFFSDSTFLTMKNTVGYQDSYEIIKNLNYNELQIVSEDNDKLIINKSFDRLSQKAKANDISVNELALAYLINKKNYSLEDYSNFRPSVVNRLDRNTGGLIIVAKNRSSANTLTKDIASKKINRYYRFLCYGHFDKTGEHICMYRKDEINNIAQLRISSEVIGYKDWKKIKTGFELIEYKNNLSLVEAKLFTGKSHQIRAHSAYLGYPILGDSKYQNHVHHLKLELPAQYLFAYRLVFSQKEKYELPLPKEFEKLLK